VGFFTFIPFLAQKKRLNFRARFSAWTAHSVNGAVLKVSWWLVLVSRKVKMSAQASKGILRVGWSSSPTKGLIGTSQGEQKVLVLVVVKIFIYKIDLLQDGALSRVEMCQVKNDLRPIVDENQQWQGIRVQTWHQLNVDQDTDLPFRELLLRFSEPPEWLELPVAIALARVDLKL
jgi:hypothetical protein